MACAQVLAQIPVVRGKSTTQSGMLYYDHQTATDAKSRTYIYTLCPDSAGCIRLDFNLVECTLTDNLMSRDFITVYDGASTEAPVLSTLGNLHGSRVVQSQQGCLTVEFKRDAQSRLSIWTALWQAQSKAACIAPQEKGTCADVQDICGPSYHENFPYYGVEAPQALETVPGTCVERQHNSTWYRFMAQQDGQLSFDIQPDNGLDDYDWVLLRGNPKDPSACPDLAQVERKLACNFSVGRGPRASTGMGDLGESASAGAADCPYSRSIAARKGDVFFLLIDDFSMHSSGFDITFNEVVMPCINPAKDLLHIDHLPRQLPPKVDARTTFSQYTRVLRIDLGEKANARLANAPLPSKLFANTETASTKSIGELAVLPRYSGIAQVLIQGLKTSSLQAYSAEDFTTPIHYGDLLNLMARQDSNTAHQPANSWWSPPVAAFDKFSQVVELIVDERIDRNTAMAKQQIRYLRLLWTDRDGLSPDYNVAVFRYEEVRDLLDRVACSNPHNDVQYVSLRDVLESQQYQGLVVGRAGKSIKTLEQGRFESDRQIELECYHWSR